jgi:DNA-binding GntR family transcriptional regulator
MGELLKTEHRSGFTDQHAAMIDAIKNGDWNALGEACEADIRASQDLLLDILAAEDGSADTP